jgi:DNA-binding CsgD family transcriptional regulator
MMNTVSPHGLTLRELDVLCLLIKGHTNIQIAIDLHLSIRTVSGHISSMKQKLHVENRAELIRFVRQNGLGC